MSLQLLARTLYFFSIVYCCISCTPNNESSQDIPLANRSSENSVQFDTPQHMNYAENSALDPRPFYKKKNFLVPTTMGILVIAGVIIYIGVNKLGNYICSPTNGTVISEGAIATCKSNLFRGLFSLFRK